jgi:hypothetical protein
LAILKHTFNLSDEALCERWVEIPYYQLFCGEAFFRHDVPFDRSSMRRWRQRMGEDKIVALIQESLNVATRVGAAKSSDFTSIIVDTTVQPKTVAFPTDAKLMHRARGKPARLAKKHGVAAILRACWQARVDRASALGSRETVQARQPGAEDIAHVSRPRDARHQAQDRRRSGQAGGFRATVVAGCGASSTTKAARQENLFPARAGDRMHRQWQIAQAL